MSHIVRTKCVAAVMGTVQVVKRLLFSVSLYKQVNICYLNCTVRRENNEKINL